MEMPHDPRPESSIALLREGYDFIGNGCRRWKSPAFQSRILFQRTYCLQGHEAARMFYENPRLSRVDAAPRMLVHTLFGEGAIQAQEGSAHTARKRLFLNLLSGEQSARLVATVKQELQQTVRAWPVMSEVDVLAHLQGVLYRSVSDWAGLTREQQSAERQAQLVAMIEGAGSVGIGHLRGRWARTRAERWGASLVARQRESSSVFPIGSPADLIATYREPGALLPARVAAVELLNLLRPVIAIAYFLVYALVELARRPTWLQQLQRGDRGLLPFVQEVRRLYAFFPFVAARVAEDFDWQGMHFARGARVLLDLYGSNRNADAWADPDEFRPERFEASELDPYTLISQGGGDHLTGHRCAGEWVTIAIMQACLSVLCRQLRYQAPILSGMPARNRFPMQFGRRFTISGVEITA